MKTQLRRFLTLFTVLCLSTSSFYVPMAQAAMVGTQAVLAADAGQALPDQRARINALLARDDVRAQMLERGVDVAAVQSRVDSLNDAEVAQIAGQIDQLPAGAGGLELVLLVFLVLLLLDIAGVTDIFSFVK